MFYHLEMNIVRMFDNRNWGYMVMKRKIFFLCCPIAIKWILLKIGKRKRNKILKYKEKREKLRVGNNLRSVYPAKTIWLHVHHIFSKPIFVSVISWGQTRSYSIPHLYLSLNLKTGNKVKTLKNGMWLFDIKCLIPFCSMFRLGSLVCIETLNRLETLCFVFLVTK